jgi:hypothetical protein
MDMDFKQSQAQIWALLLISIVALIKYLNFRELSSKQPNGASQGPRKTKMAKPKINRKNKDQGRN